MLEGEDHQREGLRGFVEKTYYLATAMPMRVDHLSTKGSRQRTLLMRYRRACNWVKPIL